jgi:hypothetical protein
LAGTGHRHSPILLTTITSMPPPEAYIRDAILTLRQDRQRRATICPSEAARALAPEEWRPLMPQVRAVALAMAADGIVDIRQGGRTAAPVEPLRGPIRPGRPCPASS